MALNDKQGVVFDVLARGVPGLCRTIGTLPTFYAPDTQTLSLTQCIKSQAQMPSKFLAFRRHDRTFLRGQIAIQKLAKRSFANKADASRILFGRVGHPQLASYAPHFGLGQLTQGK